MKSSQISDDGREPQLKGSLWLASSVPDREKFCQMQVRARLDCFSTVATELVSGQNEKHGNANEMISPDFISVHDLQITSHSTQIAWPDVRRVDIGWAARVIRSPFA